MLSSELYRTNMVVLTLNFMDLFIPVMFLYPAPMPRTLYYFFLCLFVTSCPWVIITSPVLSFAKFNKFLLLNYHFSPLQDFVTVLKTLSQLTATHSTSSGLN